MCTVIFAYKAHPIYDLIYLGNRDEFKARQTEPSKFWSNHPEMIAGKDLKAGGTWMGMTKQGRISFLTNHRDFTKIKEDGRSRGELPVRFLTEAQESKGYLKALSDEKMLYSPYNLVAGDMNELHFYSNVMDEVISVEQGVYGVSNAFFDTPWPKVEKAKERLKVLLEEKWACEDALEEALFEILEDREIVPDEQLPDTGIELELERNLSSIFIDLDTHGTVYQTVILIDKTGHVHYSERYLDGPSGMWKSHKFDFSLMMP